MRTRSPWIIGIIALIVLAFLACSKNSPTGPPSSPCTYTLSNSSLNVGASGGTASVTVTAAAGCAWTTASDRTWIAITGGNSGNGNGTVTVSLTANASEAGRTGTLTIAGKTVAVTQEGLGACSVDISPTSASYNKDAASAAVGVTAPSHCEWSATGNAGWIAITSGSGSGNGSVRYSIERNRDLIPRTGTISIAGRTFTITQAGDTPGCQYSTSASSVSFASQGGTASIGVSTANDCSWTATSDQDWITITSGATGTGNGAVNVSVSANPTNALRTGTLTVAGQTIQVQQDAGATTTCEYSVAPVEFTPCMASATMTANVVTAQGCTWTATPAAPWISVTSGQSGTGPAVIAFTVTENYDAPREGVLQVRWPTPTAGQNLQVRQAGCLYAVSTSAIDVPVTGGNRQFIVITFADPNSCGGATQSNCRWTATADVPWITITTSMPQSGDNPVSFTVAANGTGAVRIGRLSVRDKVVVITQGN